MDTKHFNANFTDRLLASFDDLDGITDGLLVHSENWQALQLLTNRYLGRVNFVYIDPPYNTDATPILYKNDYRESSWLTLLESRLLSSKWLHDKGHSCVCIAIDDTELDRLSLLLRKTYFDHDLFRVVVNHYPGSGTGRSNVTRTHEYALFLVPHDSDVLRGKIVASGERERNFRRSGTGDNNLRTGRPNSFYAVLVEPNTREIKGVEPPPTDDNYPIHPTEEGHVRIYPIGENNLERVWTLSYESAIEAIKSNILRVTERMVINRKYDDVERRNLLPSLWTDTKFSAVSHGTNLLKHLFAVSDIFSYPKSLYTVDFAIEAATHSVPNAIVLDYFAGSGTTGHATIHRNREDGGRREFILVEAGDHFNTVLLPRIKKVTFSPEWRDGKPQRQATAEEIKRSPRIIKYIRLESYEDVLDGIEFDDTAGQLKLEDRISGYLLKYMLKWETKHSRTLLKVEQLNRPFDYLLRTQADGNTRERTAEVTETFNYLMGLIVRTRRVYYDGCQRYLVYRGETRQSPGHEVVVIWRDTDGWEVDDFERDRQFVSDCKITEGSDTVYINGASCIPNAKAVESMFHDRMFAGIFT